MQSLARIFRVVDGPNHHDTTTKRDQKALVQPWKGLVQLLLGMSQGAAPTGTAQDLAKRKHAPIQGPGGCTKYPWRFEQGGYLRQILNARV